MILSALAAMAAGNYPYPRSPAAVPSRRSLRRAMIKLIQMWSSWWPHWRPRMLA
jgi:hypothetical protein